MLKQINLFITFISLSLLFNWQTQVKAVPDTTPEQAEASQSQPGIDVFQSVINRQANANYNDLEAILRLMSRESRSNLFGGLKTSAQMRALDKDYSQATEALKAKLEKIGRMNGVDPNREVDLVDASFVIQALYLEALLESLQNPWEQLNPDNIKRKYEESARLNKESDLTILSVENDTAILGLTRKDSQKKSLLHLIKENEQWVTATREEVSRARISQNKLNYVYSSSWSSSAEISFLSNIEIQEVAPEWYKALPATTAKQKDIQAGDIVIAFISKGFGGYRVVSIEKEENGDRASLIDRTNKIYQNIPLALLHKPEDFIDRDRPLEIGDAVFVSSGAAPISRVSKIENFEPSVKYVYSDEVEEKTPRSIIIPLPKTGYLLRKVAYRHDGDTEVGMVVVESEAKVWIDTPSPSLDVVAVAKTDVKPLNLPDADLGARKVWKTNFGYKRQVQIVRVMERGLLYEIEKKYSIDEDKYDFISFDKISLEEPVVESSE